MRWARDVPQVLAFAALLAAGGAPPASAGRPAWESLGPPSRYFHALALDGQRRFVLIGGTNTETAARAQDDVWIIPADTVENARRVYPTGLGPAPLNDLHRGGTAYFDRVGSQVLFVSATNAGELDPDAQGVQVWSLKLDGSPRWRLLSPHGTAPLIRTNPAVALDAAGRRLFLFGGSQEPYSRFPRVYLDDFWVLQFGTDTTWTELSSGGNRPPGRDRATLVYEFARDALVLFGGNTATGAMNDLWICNLAVTTSWNEVTPIAPWPAPRSAAAVAVASTNFVLHGGADGSVFLGDTWRFNYVSPTDAWSLITPSGVGPGAVAHARAVWDSATSSSVFYGGARAGAPGLAPQNRATRMVEDPLPRWLPLAVGLTPPPDRTGAAAYRDAANQRVVVLPGLDLASPDSGASVASAALGAGLTNWTVSVIPALNPGPRWAYASCLDAKRNRALLFGGWNARTNSAADSTVWALDLATYQWSTLTIAGAAPRGRAAASAVYDTDRDRVVIFGGVVHSSFGDSAMSDLWSLDLAGTPTWAPISTTGPVPFARSGHAAVLDRFRHRMLVTGSAYPVAPYDELWSLDLIVPAWTSLTTTGTTFGYCLGASAVVDSARDAMFLIGSPCAGTPGIPFVSSLDLATRAWTQLEPAAPPVRAFEYGAIVPDPARDRYILVGGGRGDPDPWAFRPTAAVPPRIDLVRATIDANPNGQFLWASPDRSAMHATLYRSIDGGPWTSLGPRDANPRGVFAHLEPTIQANVTYDYRFGVIENGTEVYVGTTRLIGPATLGFTIGAFPNPATSQLHIRYSLPYNVDPRGRIELYDITGRRLRWLEIPDLNHGVYTMDLGAGLDLKPGIYYVRLTQRPDFAVTSRVVVLE